MKKITASIVAAVYMTSMVGCATQGSGSKTASNDDVCNPLVTGLIGGLAGALIGGKNNAVGGAAIGAAVGGLACLAVNYATKQTSTPEEARQQYQATSKKPLTAPALVAYKTAADPNVKKGSNEVIKSSVTVATPKGQDVDIKEKIVLTSPTGETVTSVKDVSKGAGGGYENTFKVPVDSKMPGGVWKYDTVLLVDSKPVGKSSGTFTVI